ncbi:glycoside hydrolase family 3 N-terminal domain-containing protein [Henriciella sp. AS95]|uniref:glycoside hydrolase family 3 N-terminal domain-containing protein n=1 Tax=Henriciella sp. AS95 TaxID=3135782 RepID=UPI00317E0C88
MTTDEKLGQLVQAAGGRSKNLNSRLTPEELDRVRRGAVGSYLHVAGAEPLAALQEVAVNEGPHGIPLLFAMDVVHGYRTIFPVPIAMASTWDPDDWQRAAAISADEATSAGLHWTFAPMVDIARDGRWGRVVEGAGSDPYLGSLMASAQVRGFQGEDLASNKTMLAATKHFGAYGAATGGRDYGAADISDRTLNEVYLPPFYAAAEAGSGSFMTAFNDVAGAPTTGNEALVDGVLRDRWGFDGMIVSDWNAIAELMNHGVAATRAEAGALALKAGIDMDMTSGIFGAELADAIAADPSLMADLDNAVGRILTTKERLGLFDDALAYNDASREAETLMSPEFRQASRDIAARTVVLLKNENAVLPLPVDGEQNIAVIGALADDQLTQLGSWRAQGHADDVVSILDGIYDAAPEGATVSYEPGADTKTANAEDIAAAADLAAASDIVLLVIGEDFDLSGEARSRSDISLPASQKQLADAVFAAGKPVIVLLVTGRPLAIPEIDEQAEAVLNTWMLGVEAGPAVADIVFGQKSPAGRLPIDFPRATGQSPITYSELPSGRPADADLSKDSNRYIDRPITPLYPFGHGLSYASFDYGTPTVSAANVAPDEAFTISVPVTNTSDRDAEEVVQLYMRDPVASVSRPKLELRGFERVFIPAGATSTVSFTLTPAQAAIYAGDGDWQIEPGDLIFSIGASSADLKGSVSVNVTGSASTRIPAAAIPTKVQVQ